MDDFSAQVVAAAAQLRDSAGNLTFGLPVAYTYNPLDYAWEPHVMYLEKYANGPKKNLFLGMNPGPFGMAQTGVPFGEVDAVKNWLHIETPVSQPAKTHPKRPVEGFACTRSEVSGRRLWGLFKEEFGTAECFFRENFVVNYCPLVWMGETGSNITPDKLPIDRQNEVDDICMDHLVRLMAIFKPELLIGVGGYAVKRLEAAARRLPEMQFKIGTILHPSPASPIANKHWPERPIEQLKELGVIRP